MEKAAIPTEEAPAAPAADVGKIAVGKWKSECFAQGEIFAKAKFDIKPDSWHIDYITFQDAECSKPSMMMTMDGGWTVIGPSPTISGAK